MIARLIPWWIWVSAASTLLTVAVYFSIPAHADPVEPQVTNYAKIAASAVCTTLDAYPTLPGVSGTVQAVVDDSGFTVTQAAQVVKISVITICPRHIPLLQRFVATWAPNPSTGRAA